MVLAIGSCPCVELSLVLEEGVCYEQCDLLTKPFQLLSCFILCSKAKLACYSRYLLTSYFYIPVPYDGKDIFFGVKSRRPVGLHRTIQLQLLQLVAGAQTCITVLLNGLPQKGTEIILSFLILHPSTAFQTLVDYGGY